MEKYLPIISALKELIAALADLSWPIITLIIFFSLRQEIVKVFPRVKKWKIFGNEVEVGDLSHEEKEEKNQKELKEVIATEEEVLEEENEVGLEQAEQQDTNNAEYTPILTREKYSTLLPKVETAALKKFEKSLGFEIRRDIKIEGAQFDAYGINNKGHAYFIEVKVLPNVVDKLGGLRTSYIVARLNIWISAFLPKVSTYAEKIGKNERAILMFVLVLDTDKNLDRLRKKIDKLRAIYNQGNSKVIVKFASYNLSKLKEFEPGS